VLRTGHSGFVGSWLCTVRLRLGAQVVGYSADDDEDARSRSRWLTGLGVTSTTADIRDLEALCAAMAGPPFDAVVHLAAQPLVSVGHARPYATLDTNIGGSLAVLEAARLCRPTVLVHVTSDKCYRNRSWPWGYREIDELGGGCPYSVSKAAAELVFEAYADLYATDPAGPRVASVRFGNVIGGGDFAARRLVPDCMRALVASRPIALRRPAAVRPFQHVLDVVRGLLRLVERLRIGAIPGGEVFNFAPPHDGATVGRLAAALAREWGVEAVLAESAPVPFPEEAVLLLDGRKAAGALAWRHLLDIEESAGWIVRWHRLMLDGAGPAVATSHQVEEFLALAEPTVGVAG